MSPEQENHEPDRNFRVVPASRGLAWLIVAASLLRRQVWRLLTVAVLVQVLMSLTRFPVLGLLVALAIPLLSAGMLNCFHNVRRGLPVSPLLLFAPFSDTRIAARLFLLGGIIGFLAVILISMMLSGAEALRDPELLARMEQGDLQAVLSMDPALVRRVLLAVAVGFGISGTLGYFSVPLIWFRRLPVGAAIATGIKALVRNWLPFMVLALVLTALSIPAFLVLGILVGLTAATGEVGLIQYAIFLFAVLVIQLLLFGTQYCAYCEIFALGGDDPEQQGESAQPPDDQLVA